jgi:hypothetical protein
VVVGRVARVLRRRKKVRALCSAAAGTSKQVVRDESSERASEAEKRPSRRARELSAATVRVQQSDRQ